MKQGNTILTQSLCGLLLASGLLLHAADQPPPKQTADAKVSEPNAADAWQRRIPEVRVDNLPLGEIIDRLRAEFPEINFIAKQQGAVDVDLNSIPVTLRVRAVTLKEVLVALELAAQHPIRITGGPDDRLVIFEAKSPAEIAATAPVQPVVVTRIFNLTRYLAGRSSNEINEAMRELQEVLEITGAMIESSTGDKPLRPQLNLHRGTKLLIVVGQPEELAIVEQVVGELQRGAGTDPGLKPSAGPPAPAASRPAAKF